MIYYGITINLSNYSITEHYNYILKDDISTYNDISEKILYILPNQSVLIIFMYILPNANCT